MVDRFEHLKTYLSAWKDPERMATALAEDFVLNDPTEPEPITKDTIGAWMDRWDTRVKSINGTGEIENLDEAEVDRDGVLVHWVWWHIVGSDAQGAAKIKVTDAGVSHQKIAIHKLPVPT